MKYYATIGKYSGTLKMLNIIDSSGKKSDKTEKN